jgi:hypothetical protein
MAGSFGVGVYGQHTEPEELCMPGRSPLHRRAAAGLDSAATLRAAGGGALLFLLFARLGDSWIEEVVKLVQLGISAAVFAANGATTYALTLGIGGTIAVALRSQVDELAVAARGGDRAAMASIYTTVAPAIFGWARVRVRERFHGQLHQDLRQWQPGAGI